MYTLILTLVLIANHGAESSVEVDSIDGFETQARCQLAADAWIAQQNTIKPAYVRVMPKALCVRKTD